jgi:predicted nucleic acid-binding Zn ribbon protein
MEHGFAERIEQASVLEEWPQLVGRTVAGVTKPLAVAADGTLFVSVRTPAWMTELAMMEREILKAINGKDGPARVNRIRWQLGR